MAVRCFIFIGLSALGACTPVPPGGLSSLTLPPERNHLDAAGGLSFALPVVWSPPDDDAAGQVMHGPAGTDAFYATLAVQHRPAPTDQRLDEAVALALAPVSREPGFGWDNLSVEAVGQDLALGYAVRFNALEMAFRQVGLVLVHHGVLVAITLSAPADLFESVTPVFQRARDTLMVLPKPPPGPTRSAAQMTIDTHPSIRSPR